MLKMNLNLGYKVRGTLREGVKDPTTGREVQASYWKHDRAITEFLIRSALVAKYPKGNSKDKSIKKKNARILDPLAEALNEERDEVELTMEQVEHVQDALAQWDECVVEWQGPLVKLEAYVEDLLKDQAEKEKAEKSKNGTEVPATAAAKA